MIIKICSFLLLLMLIPLESFSQVPLDTSDHQKDIREKSMSFFPILMYDSDIGFGFGGRGVIKNQFRKNESFDLILFASSKGEQWYAFTFSIPDFELRQGTQYSLAFDIKVEFDKLIKSNFFGFGNASKDNDWQFPREFSKLELTLGRAFTKTLIAEFGLFYNYTSVYGYQKINPLLSENVAGVGENLTSYLTMRLRWDNRDSQINPQRGWRINSNADFAAKAFGGDYNFQRYRLEISNYKKLWYLNHILAFRIWAQHIKGIAPYYEQSIIGGGWTARGYKLNRFVDAAMILTSMEYRCMIYKNLGGILFVDSGRTFPSIFKSNFLHFKTDYGWGLRYYLTNFVVRFDLGLSREGSRIFFNFGHVF